MMKKILFFLLICLLGKGISAQDNHFSQAFSAPVTLNPAMTGLFDGGYRISAIYRDQWRNILLNRLASFSGIGEVRFGEEKKRNRKADFWGIGLLFNADRVSQFDFNSTQLGLSGAFHKSLDKKNRQYISVGYKMGVVQRNINYENLTFQDQFNGVNAFQGETQELLPANNFGYFDMGVGLHYSANINDQLRIFLGGSYDHLATPNISFFSGNTFISQEVGMEGEIVTFPTNPVDRKITGHFTLQSTVSETFSILPRVIFIRQGQHTQVQLGTNFGFDIGLVDRKTLNFGIWARGVQDEDQSPRLESVIAMLGLDLKGVQFGFSYEHNIDDITNELIGQGAFELSVSYIGNYENVVNYCPDF